MNKHAHTERQRHVCCSIEITCDPATLYAIWSDVAQWHSWDPDTRWARLNGPLIVGSRGRIAPQKGFALDMVVTEATANQSFTVSCRILGNAMHFEHVLKPTTKGVLANHQVHFEGWLAGLLMRTVGADLTRGLPVTLERLKQRCESAAHTMDVARIT